MDIRMAKHWMKISIVSNSIVKVQVEPLIEPLEIHFGFTIIYFDFFFKISCH